MCAHNPADRGIVATFYKVNLTLIDASMLLQKPMKVSVFGGAEQLMGVLACNFAELSIGQQFEAWYHVTLQFPLCKVWMKAKADVAVVNHNMVLNQFFATPMQK